MIANRDASKATIPWLLRMAVVIAALVFTWSSLAPSFISGDGQYWRFPQGDVAEGQIGWNYYARDAWRFPLFNIENDHYPEGTNIYLSDSLPLLALPAKVVYTLTGSFFTYTGLWVALCFFLQVLCASRLLLALGVGNIVLHFASLVLLCYVPFLFARFGHMSLMGQFFILAEIESYVRAKRDGLGLRGWLWVCAMPIIAILVHPYLAAMSMLLALATIGDQWRERRLPTRDAAVAIGGMFFSALLVILAGGFLVASTRSFDDYGLYSLNLLSPFVPSPGTRLGQYFGIQAPPSIVGLWQYEGAAYLGAGGWFIGLACLPFWRSAVPFIKRHVVLACVLLTALLFAVSNRVGFGDVELVHLPLPDSAISVLSTFRGSGRFVWPVIYALLASCIACVAFRYRPRTALILLTTAALLQWIDVQPVQAALRGASGAAASPRLRIDDWEKLIGGYQRIFQYPSFECGGIYDSDIGGDRFLQLQIDLIAARQNKPTNSAYLARYTKDCERERQTAASNMKEVGTLFLYRSSEDIGAYLASQGQDASRCGLLDDVVVCSATENLSAWATELTQ